MMKHFYYATDYDFRRHGLFKTREEALDFFWGKNGYIEKFELDGDYYHVVEKEDIGTVPGCAYSFGTGLMNKGIRKDFVPWLLGKAA